MNGKKKKQRHLCFVKILYKKTRRNDVKSYKGYYPTAWGIIDTDGRWTIDTDERGTIQ